MKMEEQKETNGTNGTNETKGPEKRKRRVVLDRNAKILFDSGERVEVVMVNRDVFSVMNAITEKLARTKSKEEMDAIKVSVHSVEDITKSEPPVGDEKLFEGPYLVAGLEIEGMSIPDAASELTKAIIPGDVAIRQFEILSEQLFLRSMMDAVTVVAGFSTGMSIVPLINSMREVSPRTIVGMYHGLLDAAGRLREFCAKNFPDKEFDFDAKPEEPKPQEPPSKRIVLPSGLPASMAEKGVVTPEEARKDQVKVVHLV